MFITLFARVLQMDALNAKRLTIHLECKVEVFFFILFNFKIGFQIRLDFICVNKLANVCICQVILAQWPKIRAKPLS